MGLRRSIAVLTGSAALLMGVAGTSSGASLLSPKWEAVACRNHVYTKIKECRADLSSRGYVIEKEEKPSHWEAEHAYATKSAAAREVRWLKAHHRRDALVEAEE